MKTSSGAESQRTRFPIVVGGAIASAVVLATATGVAARHIVRVTRHLHESSRLGREASAGLPSTNLPLTSVNRHGQPGDPINIECIGTSSQLGAAFAAAGWYRADEIDLVSSVRISLDSVFGRAYSTAPISNLYLFGHKENLAFERPGANVRQRDHIRFWKTGRSASDGRPIWVGSGTKDSKVELSKTNHLPTHGIAPDVDVERGLVVSELAQTGYLVEEGARPGFGEETHGVNGGGDPYFTDGQVAVLTLANVWTSPLATQVRSPLGARLAQRLEGLIRQRLPQSGLDRSEREHARLRRDSTEFHDTGNEASVSASALSADPGV
ncbi:MAG TPA: LssY C-terminal domain-containing protein [Ktedonobacterales bacterium]|jgi:hypothetical protein